MAGLSIFNIRRKATKEERFRELFLSMHPKLIRYATTLMGDADEAKDIVSEVLGRAWENFASLGDEASAWLYTATRNACLNRLKHLQVEQTHIEAIVLATQADVDNGYWEHDAEGGSHCPKFAGTYLHCSPSLLLGEEDVSTSGGATGNQSRHGEETHQQGFADAERRNERLTVIQSEAKTSC